ncbi:2-hydroxychromene-2-carboxylate isomerase [Kordiimonas sediminis]|nr:2-hydroxychromene-2-carboxylate isomerase [Kordiimonas sediminis]
MVIEFYFDFSSAYSYIAQGIIEETAARHNVTTKWKPFLLGPVFQAIGAAPASPKTPKGKYLFHDVARCARAHGMPFAMPKQFPFNSVAAGRAFYAIDAVDPAQAVAFARAVFTAAYKGEEDVSSPEVLAAIQKTLGLEVDITEAAKTALKDATQEAQDLGVFGAPTLKVGDEIFWGADRLEQAAKWASTGGW